MSDYGFIIDFIIFPWSVNFYFIFNSFTLISFILFYCSYKFLELRTIAI